MNPVGKDGQARVLASRRTLPAVLPEAAVILSLAQPSSGEWGDLELGPP